MAQHKKRSRFTHRKVSKRKPIVSDIPTDSEWKSLTTYGTFAVTDGKGNVCEFKIGETAFILPYGLLPDEDHHPTAYWIGRIKEIKARNEEDVWARVQWYWSACEVTAVIKSFNITGYCGQYERIYSDYYDYVSTTCFCDHATVKRYHERSVDQEQFDNDHFFHRFDLEYRSRRIMPKVLHSACTCNKSYNPDQDPVMHFCPRPSCRLAYHQGCLLMCEGKEFNETTWDLQLLECWPDTDTKLSVQTLVRRQKGSGYSASDPLEEFPEELVKTAQQQIVKGTQAGGVVGNVKPVVAARRMIYRVLSEGITLPADWMKHVDVVDTTFYMKKLPGLLCPQCHSPV